MIFAFYLACLAQSASADEFRMTLFASGGRSFLNLHFLIAATPELLEPIEAGLKSRMLFTLQLLERREGFFTFLGDRLVVEKTVEYSGSKDFYEEVYVLEETSGEKRTFASKEEFFKAFLSAEGIPLDEFLKMKQNPRFYLRGQAKYFPVKLLAPLTFMYYFSVPGVVESEWKTVALK